MEELQGEIHKLKPGSCGPLNVNICHLSFTTHFWDMPFHFRDVSISTTALAQIIPEKPFLTDSIHQTWGSSSLASLMLHQNHLTCWPLGSFSERPFSSISPASELNIQEFLCNRNYEFHAFQGIELFWVPWIPQSYQGWGLRRKDENLYALLHLPSQAAPSGPYSPRVSAVEGGDDVGPALC